MSDNILAEIQKQIAAGQKKLKKQKEAPAKDATFLAQSVSFAPSTFSLQPVFDFLDHLKKEPREILEARYAKLRGVAPPKEARHDWLVYTTAYKFQMDYYKANGRAIPASVIKNSSDVLTSWHGAKDGKSYDAWDPDPNDDKNPIEIWDDTRVMSVAPNPYAKGKSHAAFFAVEMAGGDGIGFEHLCKTVEGILECSVGDAQSWALDAFTKHVREGNTKILIAG